MPAGDGHVLAGRQRHATGGPLLHAVRAGQVAQQDERLVLVDRVGADRIAHGERDRHRAARRTGRHLPPGVLDVRIGAGHERIEPAAFEGEGDLALAERFAAPARTQVGGGHAEAVLEQVHVPLDGGRGGFGLDRRRRAVLGHELAALRVEERETTVETRVEADRGAKVTRALERFGRADELVHRGRRCRHEVACCRPWRSCCRPSGSRRSSRPAWNVLR